MATNTFDTVSDQLAQQLAAAEINIVKDYDPTEWQSTGSLVLDYTLGGGLPMGRAVEIFGPEHSGKTTLALMFAATAIRRGGFVAYVDAEQSVDIGWASMFGIPVGDEPGARRFFLVQPETLEEALDVIVKMAGMRRTVPGAKTQQGAFDLIIFDSIASAAPRVEIEGEMDDQHMGVKARAMSKFARKVAGPLRESKTTTLVAINQNREKIGVMFGSPITQPGGKGYRFLSSIRIEMLTQGKTLMDKETGEIAAYMLRGKTKKNKCAPPFRDFEFLCYIDGDLAGPDVYMEVAQVGKELAVFTDKNGDKINGNVKWHLFGEPLAGGINNVVAMLEDDEELFEQALAAVQAQIAAKARLHRKPQNRSEPETAIEEEVTHDYSQAV